MAARAVYPIGYVSLNTGLSAHVLRAWEKRYTAVRPSRSSSGRRLYSQEDIDRLVLLRKAVAKGHSISQIAGLDDAELAGLAGFFPPMKPKAHLSTTPPLIPDLVDDCVQAVYDLDNNALRAVLVKSEPYYERKTIIDSVIVPFMAEVGRSWRRGKLGIAHERLASVAVEVWLSSMLSRNPLKSSKAPRLLIAAPSGQYCPLGGLAIAVIAQDCGWHPVPIGANLPVEEIASAGMSIDAQIIALSLTCRLETHSIDSELMRFADRHADRCPCVVGGAASSAYKDGIEAAGGHLCASSAELVERFL